MTYIRESIIENHLRKQVKAAGGECYKWVSPGRRNVPDRIVILRGRVYFVEMKAPRGSATPGQQREIARLKALGVSVALLATKEQVDSFMNHAETYNE